MELTRNFRLFPFFCYSSVMQVLESVKPNLAFSSLLKRYTLEEFLELPEPVDGSYYELIDGVLKLVPPSKNEHNETIAVLCRSLTLYIAEYDDPERISFPGASIFFEDTWGTYLEPNMMYRNRRTSAYIVFECVSENTAIYDHTTKADTYLALGVKELWLIDLDEEIIEIRNADAQDGILFWQKRFYAKGETAKSKVLEDWQVAVNEVFAK